MWMNEYIHSKVDRLIMWYRHTFVREVPAGIHVWVRRNAKRKQLWLLKWDVMRDYHRDDFCLLSGVFYVFLVVPLPPHPIYKILQLSYFTEVLLQQSFWSAISDRGHLRNDIWDDAGKIKAVAAAKHGRKKPWLVSFSMWFSTLNIMEPLS